MGNSKSKEKGNSDKDDINCTTSNVIYIKRYYGNDAVKIATNVRNVTLEIETEKKEKE